MPLSIDWQQILLHLLNFTLLFAILYFLLYKPVKNFMEKRSQEYKKQEEDTKNKIAEAENIKTQYEQKLQNAEKEIHALKQQAEADTAKAAEAKLDDARAEAEKLIERAKVEAGRERDEILASAQKEIAQTVEQAAQKIIAESTSQTYDSFLASIERSESHDK